MMSTAFDPLSDRSQTPLAAWLLAVLVLVSCLLVVGLQWREEHQQTLEDEAAATHKEADAVQSLLMGRLGNYELALRGGAALYASVNTLTQAQWADYVAGLNWAERFPGAIGFGLASYLDQSTLMRMQDRIRSDTGAYYSIRPAGVRPEYGPVVYLSPATLENTGVIGFDMYSDPLRHEAMQLAMERGTAALSGRVQLMQDAGRGDVPALLFFVPVYHGITNPSTLAERRGAMVGWTYVPFRVQQWVDASVSPLQRQLRVRIDDVSGPQAQMLYADRGIAGDAAPVVDNMTGVYGRTWRLRFYRGPQALMMTQESAVLWAGIPIAIGLSVVVFLLAATQSRAQALAVRMTDAQRRSETLLRSSVQHSAIGMAMLDPRGHILQVNPAFSDLFGRPESHFLGRRFDNLFDADGIAAIDDVARKGVRREIRRFARADHDIRHVSVIYADIPQSEGLEVARIAQAQDITEGMRNEARINAMNRHLESRVEARTRELTDANRELESFAYSVSHDLRAPLRAIEGFSRVLGEQYASQLDEAGQGYLSRVRGAANRMGELIEAILRISRLGRSEMARERLDITTMAQQVIDDMRAAEPDRIVSVTVDPGLAADGDPVLVDNLLQNLLGNAWKFTRRTREPRIHVGRDPDDPEGFVVEDNGAGFDPVYADKLFRPFQRLHADAEFNGHGVGLASVKRIVERHGGTITATGAEGKGARFVFTLPHHKEPVAPDAGAAA